MATGVTTGVAGPFVPSRNDLVRARQRDVHGAVRCERDAIARQAAVVGERSVRRDGRAGALRFGDLTDAVTAERTGVGREQIAAQRIDGHRERAVLEPARRRRDDPFNRAGGGIELDNLGTEEAVVRDRQPGIQRTVLPNAKPPSRPEEKVASGSASAVLACPPAGPST